MQHRWIGLLKKKEEKKLCLVILPQENVNNSDQAFVGNINRIPCEYLLNSVRGRFRPLGAVNA